MSIDAHDVARHEKNRGLPDVCRKIQRANEVFAPAGRANDGQRHGEQADRGLRQAARISWRTLGFKSCTFSYPLSILASSYLSFSDSSLVNYKTEELIGVFEKIKQMKAHTVPGAQPARIAHGDAAAFAQASPRNSAAWAATSISTWTGT